MMQRTNAKLEEIVDQAFLTGSDEKQQPKNVRTPYIGGVGQRRNVQGSNEIPASPVWLGRLWFGTGLVRVLGYGDAALRPIIFMGVVFVFTCQVGLAFERETGRG